MGERTDNMRDIIPAQIQRELEEVVALVTQKDGSPKEIVRAQERVKDLENGVSQLTGILSEEQIKKIKDQFIEMKKLLGME